MNRALVCMVASWSVFACAEPQTTADPIAQTWHVAREPAFQSGGENDPAGPLFRIAGVARLGDGILVVNAGDQSVRLYSADGTLVNSFGREGGGPGEFKSPRLVGRLTGDSLLIHDGANHRLSVICGGRNLCGETTVAASGSVIGVAGGFVLVQSHRPTLGREGLIMDRFHYLVSEPNASKFDTIFEIEAAPHQVGLLGTTWASFPVPLTRLPSAAVAESVVVLTNGSDPVLRIFDFQGEERASVTLPIPVESVTESEFRGEIEDRIQRFPEQRQVAFRPIFEAMSPPAHRPAIRRIIIDRVGLIWAEREHVDPDLHSWMILDLQGKVLAEVATPPGFRVEEVGVDYLLGVWRDALDVEFVHMYGLSRE